MRARVFVCVVVMASVSGCSTISRETAYDGSAGRAFALIAADGMVANGSQSYSFGFQRIDLEKRTFLPDIFSVYFSGLGTIEGNEFTKPESLKTTVRFGGKAVPPGDYALITRTDHASYGYSNSIQVNCFSQGTTVFRIHEGRVNIIPAGHVRGNNSTDRKDLEQQAATVLSGYPKISAPVTLAESAGRVAFETKERNFLGVEMCKGTAVVSYTARGS